MSYRPLKMPDSASLSAVELVRRQIDPLLADVHAMLRLPMPGIDGLDAVCALSPALVLLAVVDGVGHCFDREPGSKADNFERVLAHFPWDEEPKTDRAITGQQAAHFLWNAYRDQLAHTLGTPRSSGQQLGPLKLLKGPLAEAEIERIESALTRLPEWQSVPTLQTGADGELRLTVKCFYWGVRRTRENALSHTEARGGVRTSATATSTPSPPLRRFIEREST